MSQVLAFPGPQTTPLFASDLGDDLLTRLVDLQQQEEAIRNSLIPASWEEEYHRGRRIELAGAAFYVLAELPKGEPPAAFLAATQQRMAERRGQLESTSTVPHSGVVWGHLDALEEMSDLVNRLLNLQLADPAV